VFRCKLLWVLVQSLYRANQLGILHSVLCFQNGLFSMGLFIYLSGRLDSSLLECQALWRDK